MIRSNFEKNICTMALEVVGKLVKVMEPVTGEGRNGGWVKQEFVLETFETYPKRICASVWGDKTEQLRRFTIGDDVKASINIESREYNERWYTEIRAWRLDPAGQAVAGAPAAGYNPQQGGGFPQGGQPNFQQAPAQPNFQQAPANGAGGGNNFFEGGEGDDLPF